MIKIKAKRIYLNSVTDVAIKITVFQTSVQIYIPKEIYNFMDERTLKNYIKNEIYSQMEVEINGK